jgi:hypothetical protein
MTHDYKRNGTTTLFAALNVLDGSMIGQCMQQHRHQEFIRFLNAVEAKVLAGKVVHVILDNSCAQASQGHRLAGAPPALHLPLYADIGWLNAIEDFFAILTKRRIKRGAFCSIIDLQGAMNRYIAEHNLSPKPFAWTKDPEKIIAAVN